MKEKIQNILKKNFELILSNNYMINNNIDKRNSFRYKTLSKNNSNSSFNSNNSNSSFSNNKNINRNKGRNTKKNFNPIHLYKGKNAPKKLNSKNIFVNSTFNSENKYNKSFNRINHKKVKIRNELSSKDKQKQDLLHKNNNIINKCFKDDKRFLEKKETNIIKFIKTKTRKGIKEEKTYIIENKDINIFNIDINKNNNSMIYYNIDSLNNESNNKNRGINSINNDKINPNLNSITNKFKKPIVMIQNFTNYKRKNLEN